ncbi:MAG: hypothetical protein Q9162_002339 [Coniocarpon cinnabarinum]
MANIPWLSTYRHNGDVDIIEYEDAFPRPVSRSENQKPHLVALVGKGVKSVALRAVFAAEGEVIAQEPHGQVRLWNVPSTAQASSPTIFLDCEIHEQRFSQNVRTPTTGPETSRRLRFENDTNGLPAQWDVGLKLYAQVIRPIASVICLFCDDLDGINGTQEALASLISLSTRTDTPKLALCRLVVLVPVHTELEVDREKILLTLVEGTTQLLVDSHCCNTREDAVGWLRHSFGDINVGLLDNSVSPATRMDHFDRTLQDELSIVEESRLTCRRMFTLNHSIALMRTALSSFATDSRHKFSLIGASQSLCAPSEDLHLHIKELMDQLGTQQAISHIAIPLLASAFVLQSCPPGMHCKYTHSTASQFAN